jgi:hypothetical protein
VAVGVAATTGSDSRSYVPQSTVRRIPEHRYFWNGACLIHAAIAVLIIALFIIPEQASAQIPNYSDLVQEAYRSFGPGELEGCGERAGELVKAKLTFRAAYLIHQKDPDIGLFKKEQGNNVEGKSVDILVNRKGDFADVATDRQPSPGCFTAHPVWVPNGPDANTRDLTRWVKPERAWAGFPPDPEPQPEPNPGTIEPNPGTVIDYAALVARMEEMEQRILARVDRPGWFTKVFGNRYVQLIGASAGAGIVAWLQGEPKK